MSKSYAIEIITIPVAERNAGERGKGRSNGAWRGRRRAAPAETPAEAHATAAEEDTSRESRDERTVGNARRERHIVVSAGAVRLFPRC